MRAYLVCTNKITLPKLHCHSYLSTNYALVRAHSTVCRVSSAKVALECPRFLECKAKSRQFERTMVSGTFFEVSPRGLLKNACWRAGLGTSTSAMLSLA